MTVPRPAAQLRPDDSRRSVLACHIAQDAADLRAHWAVRHAVFVEEQRVFARSDLDAYDADDRTIHCVGMHEGQVAGAVRLYPLDATGSCWQGDRLAVLATHRTAGLGGPLVRFAVATAQAHAGSQMTAHIQPSNVRFFEHLGWRRFGDLETYVGLPHQPMIITW